MINDFTDKRIEDKDGKLLFEHIKHCQECNDYYNKIVMLDKNLKNLFHEKKVPSDTFNRDVMEKIEALNNPNTFKEVGFMSKKVNAACIAITLLIGMFIPINEKSFASTIGEWFKKLTFETQGYNVEIETNLVDKGSNDNSENMIRGKIKEYKDIAEAKQNIPINFYIPQDLHREYELQYIRHEEYEIGDEYVQLCYKDYRPDLSEKYGEKYENAFDPITIYYNAHRGTPVDNIIGFTLGKGFVVKKIKVLGIDGFIGFKKEKNKYCIESTDIAMQLYTPNLEFSNILIFRTSRGEMTQEKKQELEDELIKIAEDIISEYQQQ